MVPLNAFRTNRMVPAGESPQRLATFAAVLVSFVLLTACAETVTVTPHEPDLSVEKGPAVQLGPGRRAEGLTQWYFHCKPELKYTSSFDPEKHNVTVAVTGAKMEIGLSMKQRITGTNDHVSKHEQGHVDICKKIYADAPAIARGCCLDMVGTYLNAVGVDEKQAAAAAVAIGKQELCRNYLDKTSARVDRISDIYDRISAQRKSTPPEQALKEAFAEEAADRNLKGKRI
jgi:hypothetical protein